MAGFPILWEEALFLLILRTRVRLLSRVQSDYILKFLSDIDSICFSVVYTYCQQIVLPAKLEQFEARRKTPGLVVCDFTPQEATRGFKYTLESSIDGNNFINRTRNTFGYW